MGLLKKLLWCGLLVVIFAVGWQWANYVDIEEFYEGKRVIITGASRGIGKELAIQLSKLGAKLVLAARSEDKLRATQQACLQHSPNVEMVVADISSEEQCQSVVDRAVESFGGIDVLVLNAAYSPQPSWFADIEKPGKTFAHTFGVNVLQSVHMVHQALPYLNQSQGIIVPVSSGSAIGAIPMVSAYATSKHALNGFFKILNQEFIMSNTPISITIMLVPYVSTKVAVDNWKPIRLEDAMTPEVCVDIMIRGIPLRRLWYHVDWMIFFFNRFYSLSPSFFDFFTRQHLVSTSRLFS